MWCRSTPFLKLFLGPVSGLNRRSRQRKLFYDAVNMATASKSTKSEPESTNTVLKSSKSSLGSTNSVQVSSELTKLDVESSIRPSELTKSAQDSTELTPKQLESMNSSAKSTKSALEPTEMTNSPQESTDLAPKLSELPKLSQESTISDLNLSELTNSSLELLKSSEEPLKSRLELTESVLKPPPSVREMKTLDRSRFTKPVTVPCFLVAGDRIDMILKPIKPFLLKLVQFKAVYEDDETPTNRWILLNPDRVKTVSDLDPISRKILRDEGVETLQSKEIELKYEHWKSDEILKAVLPDDREKSTSYSRIGHIVHLNLREHLNDYRYLIGQVLIDKLVGATCVVNKTDTIDTTYRNFKMEVVAGDGTTMIANVRENGCQFEFDFSEVFWNPRLSGEHERIVEKLPERSVLYDVFAGVGPFAVPAARFKKCRVLANDLNPSSFKYLKRNIELNKVKDKVTAYNMDGRKFLKEVVAHDIVSCVSDDESEFHVVMNLPAMAVEFLDAFRGLFSVRDEETVLSKSPTVHCYMFCKGDEGTLRETAISMVESVLREPTMDRSSIEVALVRKVSPNKEMVRVSFVVPKTVLFAVDVEDGQEPPSKKLCHDDTNSN